MKLDIPFVKGCVTPLMACVLCILVTIIIGNLQVILEKANKCTTIKEQGVKDCPFWIYGINGILGVISCAVCLFAIIKLFQPKFLC